MTRIASCSCGQLKLTMQGDPTDVTVCHCFECQFSDVSRDRKPIFNVATVFIATLRVSVRKLEDLCNLALLRLRGNRKRVAVSGEALLVSA